MSRKKRPPAIRTHALDQADRNLAPEQLPELNAAFYDGFNVDSFTIRLMMLCLAHDGHDRVAPLLEEGVSWDKLQLASDVDAEELKQYAELEVLSLHHHLCETVLRLFWVHALADPCPWLALAKLRTPKDLKDVATKYLAGGPWSVADPAARRNGHAWTLYGCGDLQAATDDRLGPSVDRAIDWIELAANTVLASPMYNAYKHGLAILPSPAFEMRIGTPGDMLSMKGGRGYQYLELEGPTKHTNRWHWMRTQGYVDFAGRAAEASVLTIILRSILSTGAVAHGVEKTGNHTLLKPQVTPEFARTSTDEPYEVRGFSSSLAYYRERPSASKRVRS